MCVWGGLCGGGSSGSCDTHTQTEKQSESACERASTNLYTSARAVACAGGSLTTMGEHRLNTPTQGHAVRMV